MRETGTHEDVGSAATALALEIAREEPLIRPSLVRAEILRALKESGSIEERDAIKAQVLRSLKAVPRSGTIGNPRA